MAELITREQRQMELMQQALTFMAEQYDKTGNWAVEMAKRVMSECEQIATKKKVCDDGIKRTVVVNGENFYLFVSEDGKHEVTIPFENRPENSKKRWEMNELMRNISEIHGYFEQEDC